MDEHYIYNVKKNDEAGKTKTHKLKLNIDFCDAILSGERTFDIQGNDQGFQKGDKIIFEPYKMSAPFIKHPISEKVYVITYVLSGWGLKNGYVVLSIKDTKEDCVELPCNIDDLFYIVAQGIEKGKYTGYFVDERQVSYFKYDGKEITIYDYDDIDFSVDEIFLDRKKAEAKAKELNATFCKTDL